MPANGVATGPPAPALAPSGIHFPILWWNGRGYPGRAYHKAVPVLDAIATIAEASGTQFDPVVVRAFQRVMTRLRTSEKDIQAYLARESAQSPFVNARRTVSVALQLRRKGRVALE